VDTFRKSRVHFTINPARAHVRGDEATDHWAAVSSGMYPFMRSYGFEDLDGLTVCHSIPEEAISRSTEELGARVLHVLGLERLLMLKDAIRAHSASAISGPLRHRNTLVAGRVD
jgi:phosphoglycolate phosphatase